MFPTIHAIIARWAPPNERSRLGGFIMSGKQSPYLSIMHFISRKGRSVNLRLFSIPSYIFPFLTFWFYHNILSTKQELSTLTFHEALTISSPRERNNNISWYPISSEHVRWANKENEVGATILLLVWSSDKFSWIYISCSYHCPRTCQLHRERRQTHFAVLNSYQQGTMHMQWIRDHHKFQLNRGCIESLKVPDHSLYKMGHTKCMWRIE